MAETLKASPNQTFKSSSVVCFGLRSLRRLPSADNYSGTGRSVSKETHSHAGKLVLPSWLQPKEASPQAFTTWQPAYPRASDPREIKAEAVMSL